MFFLFYLDRIFFKKSKISRRGRGGRRGRDRRGKSRSSRRGRGGGRKRRRNVISVNKEDNLGVYDGAMERGGNFER